MRGVQTFFVRSAVLSAIVLLLTTVAHAQLGPAGDLAPGEYRIRGTNNVSVSIVDIEGDLSQSPLKHDGTFWSDRLDVSGEYRFTEGRSVKLSTELLAGEDDYLAKDGFVLENLAFELEDGSYRHAYRLAAGDIRAEFSRRTLDRQIRGAMFELQPQIGSGYHSLILLTGSGVPDWAQVGKTSDDLRFHGGSYLWGNAADTTTVVASFVYADIAAGANGVHRPPRVDTEQTSASLSFDTRFSVAAVEGELAFLRTDPEGGESVDDYGFYLETHRRESGYSWRARYEQNDHGFDPVGGLGVISDRRIGEVDFAVGRIADSGRVRARLQYYQVGWDQEAVTRVDTLALGASYEHRPERWPEYKLKMELNDIGAEDGSSEVLFQRYALDLKHRFGRFAADYEASYRRSDDSVTAAPERQRLDQALYLARGFHQSEQGRDRVRVRGGMVYRRQYRDGWDSVQYETISPAIDISAHGGGHRLRFAWTFLDQDFALDRTSDLRYYTSRLDYGYSHGGHDLSLGVEQRLRRPDDREKTDATRLRLGYRYNFDLNGSF